MDMRKKESNKLLGLFILSIFLITITSNLIIAAEEGLTADEETIIRTIVSNPVVKIITGNAGGSIQSFIEGYGQEQYNKMPLGDVGVVIIHIVFWLMLAFAFSDIFASFMNFQNKYVPWVLGIGLTIIAANLGVIPWILIWMAKWTAWIGAGAIFVSMFLAFIFFVAVAFLGNLLKVRIISKKIELAGAVKGAEAKAGLDILKKVQE